MLARLEEMPEGGETNREYLNRFRDSLEDDLNFPQALATLWDLLKDSRVSPEDKKKTVLEFDRVLGLGLNRKKEEVPKKIMKLINERKAARKENDWESADRLRDEIKKLGYEINDTDDGPSTSKF